MMAISAQYRCKAAILHLTDTLGRPLPDGTDIDLHGPQGYHRRLTLNQGRATLKEVPMGLWQIGTPGEVVVTRLENQRQAHAPHSNAAYLLPRQPAACKTVQLTLLPPPIILNLREDAQADDPHRRATLSEAELDTLRRNGNNAVVFIHGFNVPYGAYGRHLRTLKVHQQGQHTQVEWEQTQTPATVLRTPEGLAERFPDATQPPARAWLAEQDLNGTDAHKWFVCMEYELNRAALGRDLEAGDWQHYTRIIHVAWSGDVFAPNYLLAERRATRAARRLTKLLRQLLAQGLRVNLLAHSLGNRVGLVALHLLGQAGYREAIDHFFLWQPAVPDTALSNDPGQDASIMRNWALVQAHKPARRYVVLYSREDNVLGPHQAEPELDLPPVPRPAAGLAESLSRPDLREDLIPGADGRVELAEAVPDLLVQHAVYELSTIIGIPFVDEVDGKPRLWFDPRQGWRQLASYLDNWINPQENVRRYEETYRRLKASLKRRPTWDDLPESLQEAFPVLGRLHDALPLDAARQLAEAQQEAVIRLRALIETDFRSKEVRPAMGWAGIEEAVKIDDSIARMFDAGKILPVNQTPWLKSHSGMQEPTEALRKEVYQKEIMNRIKKDGGGFGNY